MKKVIIINGPIGVGKSTVGKLLCSKLNKSAFLDGDWCFDLHPFIADKETKEMAVDNIIHIINNYLNCSHCDYVVFNWVMDKMEVYQKIINSIKINRMYLYEVTLICTEEALTDRWYKDNLCEWRIEEWLNISKKSLDYFRGLDTICIDTSGNTASGVTDEIYSIVVKEVL
ncbi:MAG TPA: AAA family ATPase [Clostridiales bacterium]|nr:AAA family ATPase [Clostridiales bacterium]